MAELRTIIAIDQGTTSSRAWGYAVFARVVRGMDVVDQIAAGPTGPAGPFRRDVPTETVIIEKAEIVDALPPMPAETTDEATDQAEGADGAPADGYRAPREGSPASVVSAGVETVSVALSPRRSAPVGVLTGTLGAPVIEPLVAAIGRRDVRVIPVPNDYFGGNIGVTGLMVGEDIAAVLAREPEGHRYLLPDVCLSRGVFLDGMSVDDLPRPVEVISTDGAALRRALERS